MGVTASSPADKPPLRPLALLPAGVDRIALALVVLGFALLYLPTYNELAHTIWASDEQGHGPIILAVSGWLLYARRHAIAAAATQPLRAAGWVVFVLAILVFVFGSSQHIIMFQTGSQILVLIALLLMFGGSGSLKAAWFPLFFLLFMVPLPEALVLR